MSIADEAHAEFKSVYLGMSGFEIDRRSAEKRAEMWATDRTNIADLWFDGDVERAQEAFDALPYSAIPDWGDLDRVLRAASRKPEAAPSDTDDERVARLMAYVSPLGYASALALIEAETKLIEQENVARITQAQPVQVTEAQVEAAGRVMYAHWDDWGEGDDAGNRSLMRDALEAARLAPAQPVQVEVTDALRQPHETEDTMHAGWVEG